MDFKNILLDLGYSNIKDNGRELRMRPLYRDSNNDTVLSVRKDTGYFIDFSKNVSGSFEYLVQLTLGLENVDQARVQLKEKYSITEIKREHRPKVSGTKTFPVEYISRLKPDYSYWINRGVSIETLKTFGGGTTDSGTMSNRYVFPILDENNKLIGVTGRYVKPTTNKRIPKWLHKGKVSEWNYPFQINENIIKEKKEIIMVESIGDMLSLWDSGIKNVLVVFGLNLSSKMISLLLRCDPKTIYISFNNDSSDNSAGNKAAEKIKTKLLNHFDYDQVKIALPSKNDFGDMGNDEITKWVDHYGVS